LGVVCFADARALPEGSWRAYFFGGVRMKHDPGGKVRLNDMDSLHDLAEGA
jgi:hypothetical protein